MSYLPFLRFRSSNSRVGSVFGGQVSDVERDNFEVADLHGLLVLSNGCGPVDGGSAHGSNLPARVKLPVISILGPIDSSHRGVPKQLQARLDPVTNQVPKSLTAFRDGRVRPHLDCYTAGERNQTGDPSRDTPYPRKAASTRRRRLRGLDAHFLLKVFDRLDPGAAAGSRSVGHWEVLDLGFDLD